MKVKAIVVRALMGMMAVSLGLGAVEARQKRPHKHASKHRLFTPPSDKISADERPNIYEALDPEEVCKHTKNPKCDALIENFCYKTCSPYLCSVYGSIRGMCRLVCEREDLQAECLKRGPSKAPQSRPWNRQGGSFPFTRR